MNIKACLSCLAQGKLTLAVYQVKCGSARVHLCADHRDDATDKTPTDMLPVESAANQTIKAMFAVQTVGR